MAKTERQNTAPTDGEQETGADRTSGPGSEEEARVRMGGFRHSQTAQPLDVALDETREDERRGPDGGEETARS